MKSTAWTQPTANEVLKFLAATS